MPKIRKGLTLDVALAICKETKARDEMIADLAKIAAEYNAKDRTFDALKDRERVETQRAFFDAAINPASREGADLVEALVNRAIDLLDRGQAEACDAILEFVPTEAADKALTDYFGDQQ